MTRIGRFKLLFSLMILLTLIFLPFQNCSGVHNQADQMSQSEQNLLIYQAAAMKVLTGRCISCHNSSATNVNGLTDLTDVDQLIAKAYIYPGKPQNSPLYLKIVDGLMPKNGDLLPADEMAAISDWIWVLGNPFFLPDINGSGDGPGLIGISVTYRDIQQVINARCIGCHGAGSNNGSLATYNDVRTRLQPGVPNGSVIFQEINSNSMPPAPAAPLTGTQKSMFFKWIADGALNN